MHAVFSGPIESNEVCYMVPAPQHAPPAVPILFDLNLIVTLPDTDLHAALHASCAYENSILLS